MSEFTRRQFHATLAGLALPASGVALAQDRFPSKPVKIICPFAPGGGSDFMARVAAGVLGERLSRSAIVDMSGALDPAIQKKLLTAASMPPPCSRATATSTGASTPMPNRPSWPRRRWSWPTRSRARCASTSRTTCWPWWMAGRYACRICGLDDEEIDAVVAASVKPAQSRAVYEPMFAIRRDDGARVSPQYDWRPQSTYIRRPPYWDTEGVGALALLPDNITTDHLSPSNAILADSAAGEYLARMGLPEEDFNSYATHRGDHLTAMRATFANPQLINEMAVVDGRVQKGSLARIEPEGRVVRMWEAMETYLNRRQPLIIIAGADYGQGSSRDWAAKDVRLAGVETVVAEGFERIHRTNLIGMGVLPLEFKPGVNRITLGLDGSETYDVLGERRPGADLMLVIQRRNGERVQVPVTCRLDTDEEMSVYEAGGVLQRFAQDFLASNRS